MFFVGLGSMGSFSIDILVPRVCFSFGTICSLSVESNHRGKDVKLITNSIFFFNVSRVLSTNRYR